MCVRAFKLVSLLGFERVCRVFAGARVRARVRVQRESRSVGVAAFQDWTACVRTFWQGTCSCRHGRKAVGAAGVRSGRDHDEACRVEVRTSSCGGVRGSEHRETESAGMVHLGAPDLPWWVVWAL
jgi:hypothetical protein